MSTRLGFIGGVLALTALDAVVSSRQASGRVSGLLTGASAVLEHLADPTVPAIPDLRTTAAASGTTATTPGAVVGAAAHQATHPRLPVHHHVTTA